MGAHSRTAERVLPEAVARPVRDRYFDTLRAVALVRVVTYHTFGWAWAGLVFPSMGVMFGLAGTLMARSLQRPAPTVIRSRVRRLLPPFWFWGVFVVGAMLVHGWMPGWQIVYWVVPLGDPPGNAWGEQAWEILWYLRTYLWFVLLSPLLLRVFRLAPVPVLLLSLGPVLAFQFVAAAGRPARRRAVGPGDVPVLLAPRLRAPRRRPGPAEARRAAPARVGRPRVLGGWYALAHQAEYGTMIHENPLAQAFWSAGFVTLLMYAKARFRTDFADSPGSGGWTGWSRCSTRGPSRSTSGTRSP
ncbi:acyltransferase family protein [Streptomyces purpurascens]